MTLLEAFRECGPCIGSPADTERSAAAVIVYDELQRLARKLVAPTVRDDCIQTVLLRIVRVGPRGNRNGDPDAEEGVRGYLGRSLRNAQRDLATQFQQTGADPLLSVAPFEIQERWPAEAIQRARATLDEVCIPGCAERLRSDARRIFERVIAERRAITTGALGFDDVVKGSRGEVSATSRNAVYKEQSRALRRLGDYMENHIETARLSRIDAEALRIVFDELCGRED